MSQKRLNDESINTYKRLCVFSDSWLSADLCKEWLIKVNDYTGHCKLCNSDITVRHEGFSAVKKHSVTKGHVEKLKISKANNTIKILL